MRADHAGIHAAIRPIEVELILRLASIRFAEPGVAELLDSAGSSVAWPLVLDQLIRHRVAPLAGRNLARASRRDQQAVPLSYVETLRALHAANASRNEAMLAELRDVLAACNEAGLFVAVRKGLVLAQLAYRDLSVRISNDFDLLVPPAQLADTRRVLAALGYAEGRLTADQQRVEPVDRAEQIYRRLHVPNVVLFRPVDDRFVRAFAVDISQNFFLPGLEWSLPADRLEERTQAFDQLGLQARCLTPAEGLIDLSTHLFKEATTAFYIRRDSDLNLKFLDIVAFVDAMPGFAWSAFVERVVAYGIEAPVRYALTLTAEVFPGRIPVDVLDDLGSPDESFLRSYGQADRDVRRWEGTFIDRMFDPNRSATAPASVARLTT